jgi:hypothetical protein
MKPCTDTRTLAVARTFVAIATFALASCAADDLSATTDQEPCAGQEPTQTIFLEDARGHSFRLAHFSECGWKYVSSRDESETALGNLSFSPVAESRADTPSEEPLAVFVDGPTGYTFAYVQDAGWKFVGKVTNDNP